MPGPRVPQTNGSQIGDHIIAGRQAAWSPCGDDLVELFSWLQKRFQPPVWHRYNDSYCTALEYIASSSGKNFHVTDFWKCKNIYLQETSIITECSADCTHTHTHTRIGPMQAMDCLFLPSPSWPQLVNMFCTIYWILSAISRIKVNDLNQYKKPITSEQQCSRQKAKGSSNGAKHL